MPFGAIFGALFFGLFGLWLAVTTVDTPVGSLVAPRFFLAIVSLSLGLALLLRRRWARWAGIAFALTLAILMLRVAMAGTGFAPFLFFFGALIQATLLLFPGTGAVRTPQPTPAPTLGKLLGWGAAVCTLGLAASLTFLDLPPSVPGADPDAGQVQPARGVAGRVPWSDFATGLERASADRRPVLAYFTASWCGYCKKMDRTTWKSPAVIERLADVVAVRVDVDETRPRNGQAGVDVAARYGVQGTPTLAVLDRSGQVVSRTSGYLDERQLLDWLDRSVGRPATRQPPDTIQASSP
jgi:thiol-disulfide isomerase/thioredoxin